MNQYINSLWRIDHIDNNIDNTDNTDSSNIIVGLDFGSSNSCIALWRDDKNKVKIIKNKLGNNITLHAQYIYIY